MSEATAEPCDECGTSINPSVSACPECGNEPAATARKSALILTGAGIILSFTGVGAIVGIPMILIGIVVLVALWLELADYSPTSHSF